MSTRFSLFSGFVFISLFSLMSLSLGSESPNTLTISQAIEEATKTNPELKKMELSANSASWARLEALSGHLPHLTVDGTHYFDAKYSRLGIIFGGTEVQFPSAFPQTTLGLEVSLLLFDGMGTINQYRASRLNYEASELELNHARFVLEEMIQVKFYHALAAKELARVADQNIETLEQHLKLARANQQAGFSTKVDVLRIESQMEEAQAEQILSYDNVITGRRSLNELLGVENDERPLEGSLPIPDRKKIPDQLTLDISQREDIQAQSRREQAQDKLNAASRALLFPKVTLFGMEQFYKFGSFDPVIVPNTSFQNAYAFGLRLSWNLFDGGSSIAKNVRESNNAQIASENTRKLTISSSNEFDIWRRKYIYSGALFLARKRSVEKSTESVRLAMISVRAGTKTHSEVLDAEHELFQARTGVIRAQLDASEALARLELAVGHRIDAQN